MAHFLAKIGLALAVVTAWAVFCWGIFVSPSASFFVSVCGFALSLFNSVAIAALWIFYLSKQFSTHSIRVLDVKKTAEKRKPVISKNLDLEEDDDDDPDKKAREFASTVTAQMFNRTREKMDDSLT